MKQINNMPEDLLLIEEKVDNIIKKNRKIVAFTRWIKKNAILKKLLATIIFFFVLWLIFLLIKQPLINMINSNPILSTIFEHIKLQIENRTLFGLFYAAILGALFFMSMPIELIAIYYYTNGYPPILVAISAVVGIIIGNTINYTIGRVLGKRVLNYFFKSGYNVIEEKLHKYGGWIIFGLSIITSPIDIFILICGSMKYPFKKMIKILAFGESLKYIAIYFLIDYFSVTILPFIQGIF